MAAVTQDAIKVTADLCSQPPLWAFEVLGALSSGINLPGCRPFPCGMVGPSPPATSPSRRSPAVRQAGFLGLREPWSQVSTAHPASRVQMDRRTPVLQVCVQYLSRRSETLVFFPENLVSQRHCWSWGIANRNRSEGLSCSLKPLPLWGPSPLTRSVAPGLGAACPPAAGSAFRCWS